MVLSEIVGVSSPSGAVFLTLTEMLFEGGRGFAVTKVRMLMLFPTVVLSGPTATIVGHTVGQDRAGQNTIIVGHNRSRTD